MKYTYVSIDGTKPGEIAGATSKSLLDRMRAGDQESWRRCVRLDGPLVYSWCLRAGLASEDAGDVCQEVFRTTSSIFARTFLAFLYLLTELLKLLESSIAASSILLIRYLTPLSSLALTLPHLAAIEG